MVIDFSTFAHIECSTFHIILYRIEHCHQMHNWNGQQTEFTNKIYNLFKTIESKKVGKSYVIDQIENKMLLGFSLSFTICNHFPRSFDDVCNSSERVQLFRLSQWERKLINNNKYNDWPYVLLCSLFRLRLTRMKSTPNGEHKFLFSLTFPLSLMRLIYDRNKK